MLSKWPIRNKLLVGIGLLVVIVATLSGSGFNGVYAYRSLVRSLSGRASELPLAGELSKEVTNLLLLVEEIRGAQAVARATDTDEPITGSSLLERFANRMTEMRKTLEKYRAELDSNSRDDSRINDNRGEWQTVYKIDVAVDRIVAAQEVDGWIADAGQVETIRLELERLENLTWDLPGFLHERIHDIAGEVRSQYRGLIILSWITTVLAGVLLAVLIRLFYLWIFHPLRVLVRGSRRVASGEFGYRITLDTKDEMSELAEAMNDMTARFEAIRDGLDRQVQERTKQVVRNEQLASVGFLAAGVAHEINNPLASIALCAESLEGRIRDVLQSAPGTSDGDAEVIRNYLRMIQTEAFRCKGITERLLDFSRMGDVTRQNTDLRQLVQGVIDMVAHLGRYKDKNLELLPGDSPIAPVNPQELKQVVLNLITNGLDSLAPGGRLQVELNRGGGQAEIVFSDNGCGMTDEVLEHLFEPFFTRSRSGQGTGLGLSISFRIVADHGGRIDAASDGPGHGSQFRVWLPLAAQQKEREHRYQAA